MMCLEIKFDRSSFGLHGCTDGGSDLLQHRSLKACNLALSRFSFEGDLCFGFLGKSEYLQVKPVFRFDDELSI